MVSSLVAFIALSNVIAVTMASVETHCQTRHPASAFQPLYKTITTILNQVVRSQPR